MFVYLTLVHPHVSIRQLLHVSFNKGANRGSVVWCNLLLSDSARMDSFPHVLKRDNKAALPISQGNLRIKCNMKQF